MLMKTEIEKKVFGSSCSTSTARANRLSKKEDGQWEPLRVSMKPFSFSFL